jgi:hypothetical protein
VWTVRDVGCVSLKFGSVKLGGDDAAGSGLAANQLDWLGHGLPGGSTGALER